MKYQKRVVVIEAVRCSEALAAARSQWSNLPHWLTAAYERGDVIFLHEGISIKTLEGTMMANSDDMIIQGVDGEIYPCKPDIFAKLYDAVE